MDRVHERLRLGNLRTNVHLRANDLHVAHFRGPIVNCASTFERDAELILVRTGRDVFVRVRIDIGIHSQSDRRARVFVRRDLIDVIELGLALDVKTVDPHVERGLDFFARFTDTSKRAFGRIAPGGSDTEELAAGNDIEPRTAFRKQLQDRAIGIRFDRVANQVIQRRQRGIKSAIVIENRPRTVNIEGRSEFFGYSRQIDIFTTQLAVVVMKKMHDEV